mmetsp:Transcript_22719/g.66964  ORF Transcript_22719/g.66964 Transcript_22719/m.66964 type:complete len:239 (-) Transcript_22719:20-736(-)
MLGTLDDRWTRLLDADELVRTQERFKESPGTDTQDGLTLSRAKTPSGRRIVVLRLPRISANSPARVRAALAGADTFDELVIDLRGNLGGNFNSAVDIAGLFLARDDQIVSVRRRAGVSETFAAVEDGPFAEVPLRVLVDRNTASASEVLAAALQENGRAKLVGESTYGKGLVQTIAKLRDGSALEITIARYETPSGRNINRSGLKPDVLSDGCAAKLPDTSNKEAERGVQCALSSYTA